MDDQGQGFGSRDTNLSYWDRTRLVCALQRLGCWSSRGTRSNRPGRSQAPCRDCLEIEEVHHGQYEYLAGEVLRVARGSPIPLSPFRRTRLRWISSATLTQRRPVDGPVHMSSKIGHDHTGMKTERDQSLVAQLFSQRYRHQHVGGLGLAVSSVLVICLAILDIAE